MAKVRKIEADPPEGRNYFLVDASFLANKHIPARLAPKPHEQERIAACHAWWTEIDRQLELDKARVFVPDICIAEAFKVLAKKYYLEHWFKTPSEYNAARKKLSRDVKTETRTLKTTARRVPWHDISTNRDIIIGVDRFFEVFLRNGMDVSTPDLIILATAKYLLEYYDMPAHMLHIVTLDKRLRAGAALVRELPNAYDPSIKLNRAEIVFS